MYLYMCIYICSVYIHICIYTYVYKVHTIIIVSQLGLSLQLTRSRFLGQGPSWCMSESRKFLQSLKWLCMLGTSHSAIFSRGVASPHFAHTVIFLHPQQFCVPPMSLSKFPWSSVSALVLSCLAGCHLSSPSLQMPHLVGLSTQYGLFVSPMPLST